MIADDNGYELDDLLERSSFGPVYRSSNMHTEFLEINGQFVLVLCGHLLIGYCRLRANCIDSGM